MAPDREELYFTLAVAYEKQGKRDDMISALKKTLEIKPDHADALNYLGYTYAEAGENLDEAISLIRRALLIKKDSGYILDSLAWAYYQKGMYQEAHEIMVKAMSKADDDPVMREHYGDILLKLGKKDKAREQWIHSLELDPKNQKLRNRYRKAGFGDPDAVVKPDQPAKQEKKEKKDKNEKKKEKP